MDSGHTTMKCAEVMAMPMGPPTNTPVFFNRTGSSEQRPRYDEICWNDGGAAGLTDKHSGVF